MSGDGIRSLLIVDDEAELREVLQLNLKKLGVAMQTAENGKEALEKALQKSYDAILCDLSMPVMDGLQFISHLRAKGLETPVVVLTAHDNKENMLKALHFGAFDFVEKPYEPKNLITTISKALDVGVRLKELDRSIKDLAHDPKQVEDLSKMKKMILLSKVARGDRAS